jgi:hypothetical protein
MIGDPVTGETPAELPSEPGDRDLELLLADVRRIADGVGAIRELAITMTAGPAPLVARANRAEVDRAWLALSGAYARGARQGDEHVYVSSHDLAVLLTVIASTVELL